MTMQFEKKHLKQFKNQSQTGYMQSNELQTAGGEAGKKNRIKTQSQSGRSMVEMLGVLAIIAVLSIGGIVGFRLAMNHYQANQIAHEMNIMRTDAQIKIAQGTEKLILGEPYDPLNESTLGHIQFNDDYPVDFACALADDEAVELSNISCHVANAYYIELQNIPEGVCRPLAELVNGMSNVIAFDVNKNEYPDKGNCEAGNENVLNAVFSAEAVSELKVCKEDTDCESESTPHCDPSRHVCVSCYEDNQCEHNQYCENNTCVTCESGVWNGEKCVECTADDDCTDSDTPKCNTDTNTCVECIESRDCEEELVCRGNECTTCETEDECQAKGENYHCSNASTCIQCPANQVWDNEGLRCVECIRNENCFEKDINKPVCNLDTNTCGPCPNEGEAWNEEQQKCAPVVCTTNAECFEHLDQNYYCDKTPVDSCGENETGICKKFELDLHGPVNGVSIDASAKIVVNYWNNCRICEANAGQDGAGCSDNSYLSPYMLTTDFLDCADRRDPSTFHKQWFCHENSTGDGGFDKDNISHNIQDLRELFRCPRLPEPNKNICKVSPVLAVYNPDYPCDAFRIGLAEDYSNPGGFGWGDMGFCLKSVLGGRQHTHRGIICKKH